MNISSLISHLHPVLVHLPIGILVLACFFQWLIMIPRFAGLRLAIPAMLFWGMLAAIASCISGYMLGHSGDYEGDIVDRHQWLGIFTAILSFVFYLLYKLSIGDIIARSIALLLLILITITGHLGGTLTHGEGYLTEAFEGSGSAKGPALKPIPDVQNAIAYADIVKPLLEARCYSCHGPDKQKGKLRLDSPDRMLKGGEDGKAVVPGKADESKMIELILLPAEDKKHMPPREKSQLTQTEINLLHWWINSGADFTKKVKDIPQDEKVKPVLIALQSGTNEAKELSDVPGTEVKAANETTIGRLRAAGVVVIPVARNSNYLSINFVTANISDSLFNFLADIKEQVTWLKLDHRKLSDAIISAISKCLALTRLELSNTNITDQQLSKLQSLQNLQSLNLVGTTISRQGLVSLKNLTNLKNIYLFKTQVGRADWDLLKQAFPNAVLDSGGYRVTTLVSDTTMVTAEKK